MSQFTPEDFLKQDSYFMRAVQAKYLANLAAGMSPDEADQNVAFYFFQRHLQGWPFFTVSNHEQVLEHLTGLARHGITEEIVEYYRGKTTNGVRDYDERFLARMPQVNFSDLVYEGIPEGTLIGGNIPIARVTGSFIAVAALESFINGALGSGMAWSSMVSADYHEFSKQLGMEIPFVDFGMRGTNPDASPWMSRSACIGGTVGTSNEYAAQKYGINERGTMFHGYILSFMPDSDSPEYEAFYQFGKANPNNAVFLVDTASTEHGMVNAIAAAKTLQEEQGAAFTFSGVRIDSGNTTAEVCALYKFARKSLDASGFEKADVYLSGDMNQDKIIDIIRAIQADPKLQGARLPRFAVGRQLAKTYPLGMTAKIAEIELNGQRHDLLKPALDQAIKRTYPGMASPYAVYDDQGMLIANAVVDANDLSTLGLATHSKDSSKTLDLGEALKERRLVPLLKTLFEDGARTGFGREGVAEQSARARDQRKQVPHGLDHIPTFVDDRVRARMAELTREIADKAMQLPKTKHAAQIAETLAKIAKDTGLHTPGDVIEGEFRIVENSKERAK